MMLLLLGCNSWIDEKPACDLDVYEWSDDLMAHVLAGDGTGEFAYDPIDVPRMGIEGAYHYDTGDFRYKAAFTEDYYIREEAVEGYGTLYHNGDLDLFFTTTSLDTLGEEAATNSRVERTGCEMNVTHWPAADEQASSAIARFGVYEADDSFHWEAEDDGYTYEGGMRMNLSRTVRAEAKDGSYEVSWTYKPEGIADADWEQDCGDGYDCVGTTHLRYDGGRDVAYEAYDDDEVVASATGSFDYDGSGEEVIVSFDGDEEVSCTYEYRSVDQCSYSCDDGQEGRC